MRPSIALYLLTVAAPLVVADVSFTAPVAGASVPGGTTFTVSWKDSGVAPALADLLSYELFLYAGSNAVTAQGQITRLAGGAFTANTVTVTVPIALAGPGTNAYYIGMLSTAKAGGTVTNYSGRFTLTGMTGTFNAVVLASIPNIAGTAGPPTVNAVVNAPAAAGPAGGSIDAGAWATPYNLQEGVVKYAPMQPIPQQKITATNTKPLWPTSSVSLAATFLPIPSIYTTQTQPATVKISSHANTAAPASQPADDMQKYLNRWKD